MPHLILIRHSVSQQQPGVSAHEWVLTEDGKTRCDHLAEHLREYPIDQIFSSDEPKAHLTAAIVAEKLGLPPVEIHAGLRETHRATAPYFDSAADFQAAIQAAMLEPDKLLFGEETFAAAKHRFANTIAELIAQHPDKTIAATTHGTMMSLYLAEIAGRAVYDLWQSLKMPAYALLTLPVVRFVKLVESVE
jgi:broad specificity phosphatase PhoE